MIRQLEQMGAPADFIAAERAKLAPQDFELFEDNAYAVHVFQRMRTQWRTRGMDGQITGLDYAGFGMVARVCGVPPKQRVQVFEDMQLLELETLAITAEQRKAAEK